MAKQFFFDEKENCQYGNWYNFQTDVFDFKITKIEDNCTVLQLYENTGKLNNNYYFKINILVFI